MKMPCIPEWKREKEITLFKANVSQRLIARKLQISLTCSNAVQHIIRKFQCGYGISNLQKWGAPRKTSIREERRIIIRSKANPKLTANELRTECGLSEKVSVDTVKRILRRAGLYGRIAIKKSMLTKKLKQECQKWCNERKSWKSEWSKIIVSDESKIELNPNWREYVRRGKNEGLNPKNVTLTKKFSASIMIWGAIRADGHWYLVRAPRNVDSETYQAILDAALLNMYTTRFFLQHDGASCHRSDSTRQYLTQKCIRVLPDWPPQSPDLSPIEHVWDCLKEKVRQKFPQNKDQLWEVTKEEFLHNTGLIHRKVVRDNATPYFSSFEK